MSTWLIHRGWRERKKKMGRVCVLTPYSELLRLNSKQSGDLNSGGGARTNKKLWNIWSSNTWKQILLDIS